MVGYPDLAENGRPEGATDSHTHWKVVSGALTYEVRIYVPEPLCGKVIILFHDNPETGHIGALGTAELVSRDFYSPGIDAAVRMYVTGCEVCHRMKAPHHARDGTNIPLPPPHRPWKGVTIDFVTDLPESTASAYIVDLLTLRKAMGSILSIHLHSNFTGTSSGITSGCPLRVAAVPNRYLEHPKPTRDVAV